jgi:hypothetical protein
MTVTGKDSPESVKIRVMPHLRPTRPMDIVYPHTAETSIGSRCYCKLAGGLDA